MARKFRWLPRPLVKIYDFFRYDIPQGIGSLILWFPVIWKDRWWDQYFIYKILHFKLKKMEQNTIKYGHHVGANKCAERMHVCVLLLDRLLKDEYHENAFIWHDKKWGEIEFNFHPIDGTEHSTLELTRPNCRTDEEHEQENKEYRRISVLVAKKRQYDLEYLFYLLNKYIEGWWD